MLKDSNNWFKIGILHFRASGRSRIAGKRDDEKENKDKMTVKIISQNYIIMLWGKRK